MVKYKQIKTNIPEEDYKKIQEKAKAAGMKLSGYLKSVLMENNLMTKPKKFKQADPNLLYELNRLGNNLNQIAKKVNINKEIDFSIFEKLENIEKEIIKIRELN